MIERVDGSGDETVEVTGGIAKNESNGRRRNQVRRAEGGGTGLHEEVEQRRRHWHYRAAYAVITESHLRSTVGMTLSTPHI